METPKFQTRVIVGLVLIILGGLFFLNNYGFYLIPEGFLTWEYFFILVGVFFLVLSRNKIAGLVFLCIGLFNLFPELWPLVFVFVGLYIILGRNSRRRYDKRVHYERYFRHGGRGRTYSSAEFVDQNQPAVENADADVNSNDLLESINIFGGGSKIINSDNFKGGSIVSIFGGSEINLNNCKLADGENILEVVAVFGGTTLIVPNDWKVNLDVLPLFGGFSDKRIKDPNKTFQEGRSLTIKGIVLFGGGELKTSF